MLSRYDLLSLDKSHAIWPLTGKVESGLCQICSLLHWAAQSAPRCDI